MGNEKKSISVEVDPELHDDWSSFVDEQDDITTLSGLIRTAVKDYIAEERGDRTPPGGEQPAQVDLSPVEDSLYTIENRLSSLERELESIDVASSARDDDRIEELAHYCREYLPLVEDKDELADLDAHATLPATELAQVTGTVEDITDAIRVDAEQHAEDSDTEDDDLPTEIDPWDVEIRSIIGSTLTGGRYFSPPNAQYLVGWPNYIYQTFRLLTSPKTYDF